MTTVFTELTRVDELPVVRHAYTCGDPATIAASLQTVIAVQRRVLEYGHDRAVVGNDRLGDDRPARRGHGRSDAGGSAMTTVAGDLLMRDPISLDELRANRGSVPFDETVAALVTAVEVAHEYFIQSLPYRDDPTAAEAQELLRAALRRFTFRGYA